MRARELRIPSIAISNSRIEIVHKATRQVQVKDNDFINDSLDALGNPIEFDEGENLWFMFFIISVRVDLLFPRTVIKECSGKVVGK